MSTLRGKSFKRCTSCNTMAASNRAKHCTHCGAEFVRRTRPRPAVSRPRKKVRFNLDVFLVTAVQLENEGDALLEKEMGDFLDEWLGLEAKAIKALDAFDFSI